MRSNVTAGKMCLILQVMYPAIERYLDETVARELELLNADR